MSRCNDLHIIDDFLSAKACAETLRHIAEYRLNHELPEIRRHHPKRSLRYRVIDGICIANNFPQLQRLYAKVNDVVNDLMGVELFPLNNQAASVNVNLTAPGGEYRWHYDRNAVTAILYLNTVRGGETEVYRNYRLRLRRLKHTRIQRWLDSILQTPSVCGIFGSPLSVTPRRGRLLVMRGDRCLHSVTAVRGIEERINVIMTYDAPDACYRVDADLDPYLYSLKASPAFDPNYRQ